MKKIILMTAITLMTMTTFAHEVSVSESTKASALGQIADKNLAGESATTMIKSILSGQEYEKRVSVISTICDENKKSTQTSCLVKIGIDDLTDKDSGFSSVYILEYTLDENGKVLNALLSLYAG